MRVIDHITIRGFKSIKAIEQLPMRAVNVLIGANGSGKSNFIGAFGLLGEIRAGRLQDYVARAGYASVLLHFGPKVTRDIELALSFKGETNSYRLVLTRTKTDGLYCSQEEVTFWNKTLGFSSPLTESLGRYSDGKEASIAADREAGIAAHVQEHLDRCRVFHFHDTSEHSALRSTSRVADNQFLLRDGANLAAFLHLLHQKHETEYRTIQRTVRLVAPMVDDFMLEPNGKEEDSIRLRWRHKRMDGYFDASALSDGTLRFIALATLLLQPKRYKPDVLLIDEPELGLHPAAIGILGGLIKQASLDKQVIVSTQSPQLIDHFQPEDILVADLVDGATQVRRLEPGPLEVWLEDYSLGQLWEKNELGGRPVPA